MSHENLKKNWEFHIDHTRNKICKNEGFFKRSLFNAVWLLQKMALKILLKFSSGSGVFEAHFPLKIFLIKKTSVNHLSTK